MRSLGIRLPLLTLSVWMGWSLSVWAMDLRYGETVYILPTTTTWSVPTAYVATSSVVPSSYLIPSALVVPSFYPTAYFADEVVLAPATTYIETRYRRGLLGRLFGRDRLVERSVIASYPAYVPTSFSWPTYYPTTYSVVRDYTPTALDSQVAYETAYATSPAYLCAEVVSNWRVPVREAPAVKVPGTSANRGSKQVESDAVGESTIPSNVDPEPGAYTPIPNSQPTEDKSKAKSAVQTTPAKGSEADSPPNPPLVKKEPNAASAETGPAAQPQEKKAASKKDEAASKKEAATPKAAGSPAKKLEPPKVPTDDKSDLPLEPASPGANNPGETRYEVKRPVNPALSAMRPERRNVLFGKVESSAAGQPEEEVRVIVTSRSNRAIRHEGMTDAYGRFAIKLSEGDWTVNVTMPSGRVYPVSQITVTGGRILDEREGREVPSLIITR
jgi:hypothetical protein